MKRRDQNGEWSGLSVGSRRQQHPKPPPGDRPQPNRFTLSTAFNWVSPLCPTSSGIPTARKGDGAAGRGCRRKRMSFCTLKGIIITERIRVEEQRKLLQHHPTRKMADIMPFGYFLSWCLVISCPCVRENLTNHLNKGKQMTAGKS